MCYFGSLLFMLFLLIPLSCFGTTSAGLTSPRNSRTYVDFSIPRATVTLHEPVYLQFEFHNGQDQKITIYLGKNKIANFKFTITDPAGARHPLPFLRTGGMGLIGTISVNPEETYHQKILLNQWYSFSEPGKYQIKAQLVESLPAHPERPIRTWSSEEMSLEIQPRNPARLKKVCAQLATAASSPEVGPALESAETLSYIVDLVAVPYLEKVAASSDILRGIALTGLGRIAQAEGLDSVLNRLGPDNPELKAGVKQALYNLQHNVRVAD